MYRHMIIRMSDRMEQIDCACGSSFAKTHKARHVRSKRHIMHFHSTLIGNQGCNFGSLTKYPKIFKGSYWGNQKHDGSDSDDQIIENRNNFIKDLIISRVTRPPTWLNHFLEVDNDHTRDYYDHFEVYINNDNNFVVIMSPYITSDSQRFHDYEIFYKARGFKLCEPLYSDTASTFIRVVEKWSHLRMN